MLTGATGYVGGRLAPRLLDAGYRLRCYVRSPGKLSDRAWAANEDVEIIEGELKDEASLQRAMAGCDAAYFLVHSMIAAGATYAARDRSMAESFTRCAERAGVRRIIYLGGMGELGEGLSEHLRSRREVEETLASGTVPVTVLRAAMIIGSGSASFEILRYLVERLPIMVTPRWVSTESQPIAIRNVLGYLIDCLRVAETTGRTFDIGGPDVMSYRHLMELMAEVLGLPRRLILPVPVLTPRLSSLWIHLVTPLDKNIARPLAEGLRNRLVCRDNQAQELMPQELLCVRTAFQLAIGKLARSEVETVWSAAGTIPGDPDWAGGTVFVDRRSIDIDASSKAVYRAICRVGGGHGWYATSSLWRLRGWIDRLVGGPGLRRGRRNPESISYGEALDFWRVTGVKRDERLELRAEMKLPGEASLAFDIEPRGSKARLIQTARFRPRGLFGLMYWYAVLPLHHIVFNGMMRGIRRAAESLHDAPPDSSSTQS